MKDHLDVVAVVVVFIVLMISVVIIPDSAFEPKNPSLEFGNFDSITNHDSLVYDVDTLVVYYMISKQKIYSGYGYMAPYISENGNYCRYIDGEIVEIVKD